MAASAFPFVGGAGAVVDRLRTGPPRTPRSSWRARTCHLDDGRRRTATRSRGSHAAPLGGSRQPHRRHDEARDRLHRSRRFGAHTASISRARSTGLAGLLQGAVDAAAVRPSSSRIEGSNSWLTPKRRERRAAIETTPIRKLRDADGAGTRQGASQGGDPGRYLNLVSFGNGSFGVQDAEKTYSELTRRT